MDGIWLEFGPGRYHFRLKMPQILEIERNCGDRPLVTMYEDLSAGVGIEKATERAVFMFSGPVRIKDCYEIIRCAAIGGGEAEVAGEDRKVSPIDAKRLVDEYVAERADYEEFVPVAWAILDATLRSVRLKKKADEAAAGMSVSSEA